MKEVLYERECGADANYQHLKHVFEGYRAYMSTLGKVTCPHVSGGAQAFSWNMGVDLAKDDLNDPG